MITVNVGRCPFCSMPTAIEVSSEDEASAVLDWIENRRDRPYVQDAFPHFTLAQREAMISASHSDCFDAAFADEDE